MASIDYASQIHKQLSAYIDGELSPKERREVEEHLKVCPDCRAEFKRMKRVAELASESLRSERCISAADKAAYIHGFLDETKRREVEAHLKRCRNCRSEVQQLRKWVEERLQPEEDAAPAPQPKKHNNPARFITVFLPLAAAAAIVIGIASTLPPRAPAIAALNVLVPVTRSADEPQEINIGFAGSHALHTNDRIQLILDPGGWKYNYAAMFWMDATGEVHSLNAGPLTDAKYLTFVTKRRGGVATPAFKIVLPSKDTRLQLGDDVGTDVIFIVFTKEPLGGPAIGRARQALSKAGPLPEFTYGTVLWLDQNGRWTGGPSDRLNALLTALKGALSDRDVAVRSVAFAHE